MLTQDRNSTAYDQLWNSKEYLNYYYSTAHVAEDDAAIFEHLISFLQQKKRTFTKVIEFGCGPTPHHIFPIVPYLEELNFADYVPENLQEVNNWLEGNSNAHNWDMWIEYILKKEGLETVTSAEIEQRKKLIRDKSTKLKLGDVRKYHPLNDNSTYDLVVSFYCVDAATNSTREWHKYMSHLFNLVKPGGEVFIVASARAQHYDVGTNKFPEANVTKEDFYSVFTDSNFVTDSIEIKEIPIAEWVDSGLTAIIIAKATMK
jgi:SAM-dependent methyltransferase